MNFKPIFPDFPHILHGGDYNPEQWRETPEVWDEDMELMKKANCNEMTMGIFSWAEIEPEENIYDFSVLDTLMDKIYQNGGRVILATPSAARPHWLADKYPEVIRTNENGIREHFRARHNFCASSPAYRERVRIINEKLSERYCNHPALIGWHLSNEYGSGDQSGFCYCEKCTERFRVWLKEKYKTIDELNRSWWTRFWSHRYDDFSQIEPPYLGVGNQSLNALRLDWKRFSSDNLVDFMKEEIKAVRQHSQKPVTTNGMCLYPGVDYRSFAKELDFFSQDFYPVWGEGEESVGTQFGLICDYSRGLKDGKPFIVMESAPGAVGSGVVFRKIKSSKHQILEAVKYIAHGADSVMYFQWRKSRGANEKFHGAVVDHYSGDDTRIFKTVAKTGEILKKLDGVVGTRVKSDVAIVHETENWWALGQIKPSTYDNGYYDTLQSFYTAFNRRNIQTDVIGKDSDFSKYKIVVMISPYLMTQKLADKIRDYVENGGIVISTYLTAVTDENDRCHLGGVPGCGLTEVFGLRVEEVDGFAMQPSIKCKNYVSYAGKTYPICTNAEIIKCKSAETLATYTDDFYAGSPALTLNSFGKGKAYYVAFDNNGEFKNDFVDSLIKEYNLKPPFDADADPGIRLRKRENNERAYYFILNESNEEKTIRLNKSYINVLDGKSISPEQQLSPCGFLILTD